MARARRTHVDDINVLEARESEILEDLTSKATGSAAKD